MMCGDKTVLPTHRSLLIQPVILTHYPEPSAFVMPRVTDLPHVTPHLLRPPGKAQGKAPFNGHFINAKCGRTSFINRLGNGPARAGS